MSTPLLDRLLSLQTDDDRTVSHERLEAVTKAILGIAGRLENPVVVPVGETAQRLLGAMTLLSKGQVEVSTWDRDVTNRTVLLVATVTATTIEFEAAAATLRRQGATTVYACASRVDTVLPMPSVTQLFDLNTKPAARLKAV